MDENIVIRFYEPGDKEQIVQLLNLVFQGWPHFDISGTPVDHWNWKYEENPTRKHNVIVGEVNKKIVACDHGFYVTAKVGGEISLCRQGVDAAVHPDYRGRGIYPRMDKQKDEKDAVNNNKLVYSVTTNLRLMKRRARLEKDKEFPMHSTNISRLIKINDVNKFISNMQSETSFRKIILKYAIIMAKALNKIRHILSNPNRLKSISITIRNVEKFDESVNLLWDKIKNDYNFMIGLTPEYLNWRYRDPRGGNYIVKQAEENGEVIGIIVFSINKHDVNNPHGYIVELYTIRDKSDCAKLLISEALDFFDDSKINTVECWVPKGHYLKSIFNSFDFTDENNDIILSFNTKKSEDLEPLWKSKPEEVLFQLGDTDWI